MRGGLTKAGARKARHGSVNRRKRGLARRADPVLASESQIQSAICGLLETLRLPFSVTDASRSFGPDGRPRRSKVVKGWPDITGCLHGGRMFAIEVKSPKGRLSKDQQSTLQLLAQTGAAVLVARSVWDVSDFLAREQTPTSRFLRSQIGG